MSEGIGMTTDQKFGNKVLTHDQIVAMQHEFKMGRSLSNLEIQKLLQTARWAISEVEHVLSQDVS